MGQCARDAEARCMQDPTSLALLSEEPVEPWFENEAPGSASEA